MADVPEDVQRWTAKRRGGRECLAGAAEGRRGAQGRADQEAQAEGRGTGLGPRHSAGGGEGPPYGPDDVRRVKQAMPSVSERRVCATTSVPRSAVRERPTQLREPHID